MDPLLAQQLGLLITLCTTATPLNLSQDLSINLSKVTRYEPIERTKIVMPGDIPKSKPADMSWDAFFQKYAATEEGTGEYDPGIVFEGGDVIILTAEQNEIFRNVWGAYNRISGDLFAAVNQLFPKAEIPAEAAIAGEM